MVRRRHKNHSLANLSKEYCEKEWNKMGRPLKKFKALYKIKWIIRSSILWRKTPILHSVSLGKVRITVSFIHISQNILFRARENSPTRSSFRWENKDTNLGKTMTVAFQDAAHQARVPHPAPYLRLLEQSCPLLFRGWLILLQEIYNAGETNQLPKASRKQLVASAPRR